MATHGDAQVLTPFVGETVRQAFEFAQSGNAEAAIVAWSLVSDRGGILLPANLHSAIRQTGGVVKSSRQADAARQFLAGVDQAPGRLGHRIVMPFFI